MKRYLFIALFIPFAVRSQTNHVYKLTSQSASTTNFARGWIGLKDGWKYKVGDDPEWAKPEFADASWDSIRLLQDFYHLPQFSRQDIVWFRLHFIADSSINPQTVMRIYQTGASEIYLDGKLIHRLGVVSKNSDSAKYYSPQARLLSFPVALQREQTLAIRFANMPNHYPVNFNPRKATLEIWLAPLDIADHDRLEKYVIKYKERLNVVIGVAFILCVLYFSFFIFFPLQRINLYFSICNLFFAFFLISYSYKLDYHGPPFDYTVISMISTVAYLSLILYCNYKIFNQRLGWIYWSLISLAILGVPGSYFMDMGLISTLLAVLILTDVVRISIKSLRTNKIGALIILICISVDLIFWALNLMTGLGIIQVPNIDSYTPFAFLLGPLSLAIYLGYAFGTTSHSLSRKLKEVEQLSSEKQQILGLQNETLEVQVKERTAALNESLENLKSTQAQLIQSEKMASLGELTAGIAHEIQNPLNFVNNFAEVNAELIDEMQLEIEQGKLEVIKSLANDIKENENKIIQHGKRADSIVKSMLQHSGTGSGQKEATDLNALADEYLRLTYHGLRAKDNSFNCTIDTSFDPAVGRVNVMPRDIGRVILNLLTNAFYAVNEKRRLQIAGFDPTVSITTKRLNGNVEILVTDNGNGISSTVMDKIFQPFFTTKPTGQGTGLGLSLSYDIIKAHGGELKVASTEGTGSAFTIIIPAS